MPSAELSASQWSVKSHIQTARCLIFILHHAGLELTAFAIRGTSWSHWAIHRKGLPLGKHFIFGQHTDSWRAQTIIIWTLLHDKVLWNHDAVSYMFRHDNSSSIPDSNEWLIIGLDEIIIWIRCAGAGTCLKHAESPQHTVISCPSWSYRIVTSSMSYMQSADTTLTK